MLLNFDLITPNSILYIYLFLYPGAKKNDTQNALLLQLCENRPWLFWLSLFFCQLRLPMDPTWFYLDSLTTKNTTWFIHNFQLYTLFRNHNCTCIFCFPYCYPTRRLAFVELPGVPLSKQYGFIRPTKLKGGRPAGKDRKDVFGKQDWLGGSGGLLMKVKKKTYTHIEETCYIGDDWRVYENDDLRGMEPVSSVCYCQTSLTLGYSKTEIA